MDALMIIFNGRGYDVKLPFFFAFQFFEESNGLRRVSFIQTNPGSNNDSFQQKVCIFQQKYGLSCLNSKKITSRAVVFQKKFELTREKASFSE